MVTVSTNYGCPTFDFTAVWPETSRDSDNDSGAQKPRASLPNRNKP